MGRTKPGSPPIKLSIAGKGRVLELDLWSVRAVIEALAKYNSGMKRLAARLSFPWIADRDSGEPTWLRLQKRLQVSSCEIRRLDRQLNAVVIREHLALTLRAERIVTSFVPSNGTIGSRKIQFLSWNGLALEVRRISARQLLQMNSAIVATQRLEYGGFHLWRFGGTVVEGPLSARSLEVLLSDFYDYGRLWKVALAEFSNRTWYLIEKIDSLDGFQIMDERLEDRTRNLPIF